MLKTMMENQNDLFYSYEHYMRVTYGIPLQQAPTDEQKFYNEHGYGYGHYFKGIERVPFI